MFWSQTIWKTIDILALVASVAALCLSGRPSGVHRGRARGLRRLTRIRSSIRRSTRNGRHATRPRRRRHQSDVLMVERKPRSFPKKFMLGAVMFGPGIPARDPSDHSSWPRRPQGAARIKSGGTPPLEKERSASLRSGHSFRLHGRRQPKKDGAPTRRRCRQGPGVKKHYFPDARTGIR